MLRTNHSGCTVHFRCHVIVLRNLLLNRELVITLVFRFPTDVGKSCFLVFIHVKDVTLHCGPMDVVRWQGDVDLLLLRRLRGVRAESRRSKQGCCVS